MFFSLSTWALTALLAGIMLGATFAGLARRLDALHRYGAGRRRLELSVLALRELPEPQRDPALRHTLAAALAAALPPAVDPVPGAVPRPGVPHSRSST